MVSILDLVGYAAILVLILLSLQWLLRVCNPKEQNHNRKEKLSDRFKDRYWENKDRMWLYYNHWESTTPPKAVVIIVHGFAEHSGRYYPFARQLNQSSFCVYALDLRGHGRSDGYRTYINRMADVVEDVCAFVRWVHGERPSLPVFLFGHSMGGMIAILATNQLKDVLKGSIFSGPALQLDPSQMKLKPLAAVLQAVFPKLVLIRSGADGLSHDPVVVEEYGFDILNGPGVRKPALARTSYQLLVGAEAARKSAQETETPFLLMHGEQDPVCFPQGAVAFFQDARSADKEMKLWEKCYHETLNETNGEEVGAYAVAWLNKRV